MSSALTWLAYDEGEDAQLRQLVAALKDTEARDPLGFGTVRDAIADVLFPGVSTVMTRARYFLFIPRLCRRLEGKRLAGQPFATARRKGEVALIYALLAGGHDSTGEGVIGRIAKDGTKLLPSAIYWGGLGAYGIRRTPKSIARYQRGLPVLHQRQGDDTPATLSWDAGIDGIEGPDGSDGTPATFDLTLDEARYLAERIRMSQPASLLAALLNQPDDALGLDWAWETVVQVSDDRTRRVLRHSEAVSTVLHGAQLAYNHELTVRAIAVHHLDEGTAVVDIRDDMAARLDDWVGDVRHRQTELRRWVATLDELWIDLALPARAARTTRFLTDWLQAAVADPGAAVNDPPWRERMAEREKQAKGAHARITSPAAQTAWVKNPAPQAAGRLDYRWSTARTLLTDIAEGLASAPAE